MAESAVASPRVVIGVLGPVTLDGREITGARAKRLLVALALAAGQSLSAERLIDDVWGDDPPKSPASALHTQISRLRTVSAPAHIDGSDGRYRLTGATTDMDLVADRLAADDPAGAAALWRGAPGDDLGAAPVADHLADRARRLRLRVDEALARDALARGAFDVAAECARERLRTDPLDESAAVLLMTALAELGRTNEALTVFSRLRRTLVEQLGADPGPEATVLNARLLAASQTRVPAPPRRLPSPGAGLRDTGTELIGRAADLTTITADLETHRVVTVQGPGGVGKTRIATEIGRRLAQDGRAVYFVPLASVRNGDDLLAAVAGALGVGESELSNAGPRKVSAGLSERLQDALRGSSAVLILDNCEQVIDACAVLVDSILAAGPGLRILTTSRSPLLIPAEQVYQLPVLSVAGRHPSAVELFCRRARAVRPDAVMDMAAVADLCARLDGLPLAIELAAARVRTMRVEEISQRLGERFQLLRSADRTVPDRHRTLSAVIEWSWDLLDDAPRTVLARLSLFPGGFSRAAAERLSGLAGVVLDDALAALADQSLLQVYDDGGETRFRMLEMVREFGEQQLRETADEAAVAAAMRLWATDFARDLRTRVEASSDGELVVDTRREADNLIWALRSGLAATDPAALETVVQVFPVVGVYWATRGLHPEIQIWGRRVLDALTVPPPRLDDDARRAWQASVVIAVMHMMPIGEMRSIAKGRMLLRRLANRGAIFTDPFELLAAMMLCRTVYGFYRLVVEACAEFRPPAIRGLGLAVRLNMKENFGNLVGAGRDSEQLAEVEGGLNVFVSAVADIATASVHSQQGHWRTALRLYESSERRFVELDAVDDLQQVRGYIVANRLQLGDYRRARADLDAVRCGWLPGDPAPQGNPETAAVMMLVTAEYLRTAPPSADTDDLGGDAVDVAGIYRQAGQTLLAGHPMAARDPGAVMTIAAAAAGLLCLDEAESAAEFAGAVLAQSGDLMMTGWVDIPQTGNLALVTGAAVCRLSPGDPDGVALLILAQRLRVRHDYPAMHELIGRRRELSGADDAGWAAAVDAYGHLPRRRALAETQRIFDERTPLV
ncbi:BTAD domain-containing putative transcriptional regulator [Gordonia hydrophobica]|uniref:BTAD domain-containing putative transcriptional regulator n=1 Tax=Gordonia hydrophobica TaxID=40516 RepID=A0ABZ2TYG2_9ACTN|nr:BTAD domain-containing putative transcriptional regulator [Gordonia hydrophobica]MBM7366987.1 putative ATPase/DNA-binding SARP family transcriptional activator [Gordonia hydrophobica]